MEESKLHFFFGEYGSNPRLYIYYALCLTTQLSSQEVYDRESKLLAQDVKGLLTYAYCKFNDKY